MGRPAEGSPAVNGPQQEWFAGKEERLRKDRLRRQSGGRSRCGAQLAATRKVIRITAWALEMRREPDTIEAGQAKRNHEWRTVSN